MRGRALRHLGPTFATDRRDRFTAAWHLQRRTGGGFASLTLYVDAAPSVARARRERAPSPHRLSHLGGIGFVLRHCARLVSELSPRRAGEPGPQWLVLVPPSRMTVKLDFEECLKDSPRFRAAVEGVECDVFELETRLEKLLKLCGAMLDSGRQYCAASKAFVGGVRDLSQHAQGDAMMSELLDVTQQSSRQHIHTLVK
ncbi:hypothetical protein KIL84_015131, partial [Mauremys mutica]